jgi:hypothetical protein
MLPDRFSFIYYFSHLCYKHHIWTKSWSHMNITLKQLTVFFLLMHFVWQLDTKSTQLSCLWLYIIIHMLLLPFYCTFFFMKGGRVEQGYCCCIERSCLLWSKWNWTWEKEKLDSQCSKPGKILMHLIWPFIFSTVSCVILYKGKNFREAASSSWSEHHIVEILSDYSQN